MPLFAKGFVGVRTKAEEYLGHGLRCVRKGRIDDAELSRNAIHGRKGQADDEVECTDTSRNRNCKAETADKREEEGIDKSEFIHKWSGPYGRCGHKPIYHPDEGSICKEEPFPFHSQTARKALDQATEYSPDLTADGAGVAIAPKCPECGQTCDGQQTDYPPQAEVQACGHRSPDLFYEEISETVESTHYNHRQKQKHHKELPAAFQHDSSEDFVI